MSDIESTLATARQLNEARLALETAFAGVLAQLPEDARAEFSDSEVSGFAFNPGGFSPDLRLAQGLRRLGGGAGLAFFDTNGSCGAAPQFGEREL